MESKRLLRLYRDENYVSTSPRHCRSPSRYYDQRMSPRCSDYPRDSREREYRSYERETESATRDRNTRRRSHSNSLIRNQYDSERERDRDKEKHRERDRENEYRRRSRSRRSRSRRYTPVRKPSQERSERNKESLERRKEWDKEKDENHRNRDRRSYENDKEKRIYSSERGRSKEYESKRRGRSRSRSRDKSRHEKRGESKEKKKRSLSLEKQKGKEGPRKHRSSSRRRSVSRSKDEKARSPANGSNKEGHRKGVESFEKEVDKHSIIKERDEWNRSESKEKGREQIKTLSPKSTSKEDEEKKEKKKDKDKKKRKKEKETEEERAARKKKKKEKKEEKKRKQEMKNKIQENGIKNEVNSKPKDFLDADVSVSGSFVTSFKAVKNEEEEEKEEFKSSPLGAEDRNKEENVEIENGKKISDDFDLSGPSEKLGDVSELEKVERKHLERGISGVEVDGNLEDNCELQIHASHESLLEESTDSQKKGILVSVPEISKWELEDNQISDSNQKSATYEGKSPEHSAKVTREVIKRAENAIFKKAVNAIREPLKKSDKDEKKDKKISLTSEKDRSKDYKSEQESEKIKRIHSSREKDKFSHTSLEITRPKTEVKRMVNSFQITIPLNNDGKGAEREFSVDENGAKVKSQHKDKNTTRSPPPARVPIKERLGSKIDKQGRNDSPHLARNMEKWGWNETEEESKLNRKDYQRPALPSTVESIDAKRSSIDEAHFVPNYDESSDEDETLKIRFSNEKESKFESGESKKRRRSSSESSEESTKKHKKKKKSKSKKKKLKKSKKRISDSSDSSDSEREKKKHKKSKKKKKSRH